MPEDESKEINKIFEETVDTETIKENIEKVISYSQDLLVDINADKLIKNWKNNKIRFFNMMKNQLIYELPEKINWTLPENQKLKEYTSFISEIPNYHLKCFLNAISYKEFYDNKLNEEYCFLNSNDILITIPAGTKIIKDFKYFLEKESLRFWQDEASQLIQKVNFSGTFCFSIHPLDYLSSSENTHKWRSCHALDGEYRAGNLSYMTDAATIICYIKSDENTKLPRFPEDVPWNNKKWRMLLYFSDDMNMLFAGRQYPFEEEGALDFVKIKLQTEFGLKFSQWSNDFISSVGEKRLSTKYIPINRKLYDLNKVVKDYNRSQPLHYNDILRSTIYTPSYAEKETCFGSSWASDKTNFTIGNDVECLHCGRRKIEFSETVLCNSCEEDYGNLENDYFSFCDECGRHMSSVNAVYLEDTGEEICIDCYDSYGGTCCYCGGNFLNLNLITINGKTYCQDCSERIEEKEE